MAAAAEEHLRYDVGCPFCGLACDDLAIASAADRLRIAGAGCALSRERLGALAPAGALPRVDGREADLAQAVARAGEILAASRAPVFAVAADVAGARAALALAERLGGVVDHPDSDALFRNLRVVQDAGALTTTLSEVRNRADVVLVVGPDPAGALPRFHERCLAPRRTLFEDAAERALFRLGPPAGAAPAPAVDQLPCTMDRLPEAIAAVRACLTGRPVPRLDLPGLETGRLNALAARLQSARYALVAWVPAAFGDGDGELIGHALLELARAVTRTTRCSLLALGGSANLLGVNQVCTWQTGYPLRTSFGTGTPEHDPHRHAARRMIANGEADAVVWISSFDTIHEPPATGAPVVLLAPPGAAPGDVAVWIPVGVPGVDHAGQIFRGDGVVALPLRALRASALPDVRSVLERIEARLPARRVRP
jgi:formylmethanofuran dehydrogenase subunit B